jgi:hypothetical protein
MEEEETKRQGWRGNQNDLKFSRQCPVLILKISVGCREGKALGSGYFEVMSRGEKLTVVLYYFRSKF